MNNEYALYLKKVAEEYINKGMNIYPQEGKFELTTETSQRDYIIMKAIEMPYINVLWMGTLVLMMGFTMAIVRRYKEFKRSSSR